MNWANLISDHYDDIWRKTPKVSPFPYGPTDQLPDDFAVLKFPPSQDRNMWTYATRCMSVPDDAHPIELHVFSPLETDQITELLYATAHFHRTSTKLDLGHSVNFGRPWIANSICDHGLISLPYLDGPDLENLFIDFKEVKFYWLIPITNAEVTFKKTHGLESLEEKFEKSSFNYIDPARASVV